MIANKKEFGGGLVMMVGFWIVFAVLLSPIFAGQNLLDYMDSMYNSISKNSAYYIPDAKEKSRAFEGTAIDLKIEGGERQAALLRAAGMMVGEAGAGELAVRGDLGSMLAVALDDADVMFANNGEAVRGRYGVPEKEALYDWWSILKSMEKSLTSQEHFKESKMLYQVRTKSVEPAYNYYGIEAQPIRAKLTVVVLSLAGYVIYTMWFGFAILFMFEGWGLKLEH